MFAALIGKTWGGGQGPDLILGLVVENLGICKATQSRLSAGSMMVGRS